VVDFRNPDFKPNQTFPAPWNGPYFWYINETVRDDLNGSDPCAPYLDERGNTVVPCYNRTDNATTNGTDPFNNGTYSGNNGTYNGSNGTYNGNNGTYNGNNGTFGNGTYGNGTFNNGTAGNGTANFTGPCPPFDPTVAAWVWPNMPCEQRDWLQLKDFKKIGKRLLQIEFQVLRGGRGTLATGHSVSVTDNSR
jgi:hypothetical protein